MIRLSGQTRLSTFLRGNGEWIYVPPVPVFIEKLYAPFSQGPETQIYYNNNSLVYDPTSNGYYILGQFPYYGNEYVGRILRLDQTGSRDPNFNSGVGIGPGGFDGGIITSDGKLVVFVQSNGYSSSLSSTSAGVFRINSDGTLDSTFPNVVPNFYPLRSMCLQSDSKILIGGIFTQYSGSSKNRIVRINANGTVDNDFDIGTGFGGLSSNAVNAIAIQSDGKILVGGDFAVYNGVSSSGIVRLFPSGGIDPDFYTGSGFTGVTTNIVNSIAVQSDGKILVGGNYTSYSGSARNRIVRLSPSGTIDPDFNVGAGLSGAPYSIVQQPDGKILVGGVHTQYSGSTVNRIVRINPSGSIDTSFNIGTGFNSTVSGIYVQSDGKIVVKGQFRTYSGSTEPNYDGLIRLNPSGTIDTTFVNRGVRRSVTATTTNYGLCQQSDGKIVVGGDFIRYSSSVAPYIQRFNIDGTRDSSFNVGTGFNGPVYSVAQQSDGKILLVGSFNTYSGSVIGSIIRLNPSGTIDTTFNAGIGINSNGYIVKQLSDGKIIVGGLFGTYSGSTVNRIVRIMPSGTIDPDFNTGTGFAVGGDVRTIYEQSDGKILIGGNFTVYNGVSSSRIIRLNPSGGIDPDFYTGSGFNDIVYDIKQLSDGKIVIGGSFTTYSGSTRNYIVRLDASGAIDTTFNIGTGFGSSVYSIVTQSGGKILVGFVSTTYSGSAVNYIVRLNPSGTIDTTFNSGTGTARGFDNSVISMIPLQNGNILAYGPFTRYSGSAGELSSYRGNLVEITSSGSIALKQVS